MCLGKVGDKKIAEEDMTVWKVCCVKEEYVISSYRYFNYQFEEIYETPIEVEEYPDERIIHAGFHSFPNLIDAKREAEFWNERDRIKEEMVIKCTIPKGTIYYEGEFRTGIGDTVIPVPSIASEKIILHKPGQ